MDDECIQMDGFSVIRQDRNMQGGGVLLYIRNTYKAKYSSSTRQDEGKPLVPEYLMCSVQQGSVPPVFVAVVYRAPNAKLINSDLADVLERYSVGFNHRIIMGDLNANMLSASADAQFLKQLACELNIKLVEHGATHHGRECPTWIDVIFVDDDDVILDSNNTLANFPNRHNIIDVTIDIPTSVTPVPGNFTYRNFKAVRQDELMSLFQDCDWPTTNCSNTEVNTRLENLGAHLMKVGQASVS